MRRVVHETRKGPSVRYRNSAADVTITFPVGADPFQLVDCAGKHFGTESDHNTPIARAPYRGGYDKPKKRQRAKR
jgi:hypothetical protein